MAWLHGSQIFHILWHARPNLEPSDNYTYEVVRQHQAEWIWNHASILPNSERKQISVKSKCKSHFPFVGRSCPNSNIDRVQGHSGRSCQQRELSRKPNIEPWKNKYWSHQIGPWRSRIDATHATSQKTDKAPLIYWLTCQRSELATNLYAWGDADARPWPRHSLPRPPSAFCIQSPQLALHAVSTKVVVILGWRRGIDAIGQQPGSCMDSSPLRCWGTWISLCHRNEKWQVTKSCMWKASFIFHARCNAMRSTIETHRQH